MFFRCSLSSQADIVLPVIVVSLCVLSVCAQCVCVCVCVRAGAVTSSLFAARVRSELCPGCP